MVILSAAKDLLLRERRFRRGTLRATLRGMEEISGLGGAEFERALAQFRAGAPVTYRGMELTLGRASLVCRVGWTEPVEALTSRRALESLARARFRLGALLASATPLEAIVGNREPRLVLVSERTGDTPGDELYELRRDRLRRLR